MTVCSPHGLYPCFEQRSQDCVRPCSPHTQSVFKWEATFEWSGLSGEDFNVLDEAGSIRKGQQARRACKLAGMAEKMADFCPMGLSFGLFQK